MTSCPLLPAEIWTRILQFRIAHSLTLPRNGPRERRLKELLAARRVSKTFLRTINDELLAKTSINQLGTWAQSHREGPQFIDAYLRGFLYAKDEIYTHLAGHAHIFRGAQPHLPLLINRFAIGLLKFGIDNADIKNMRPQYTNDLSFALTSLNFKLVTALLIHYCPHIYAKYVVYLYWEEEELEGLDGLFVPDNLAVAAAAAAAGNLKAVKHFLSVALRDEYDIDSTKLFCSPFLATAATGKHEIPKFLFEEARKSAARLEKNKGREVVMTDDHLDAILRVAISCLQFDTVTALFDLFRSDPKCKRKRLSTFLKEAGNTGCVEMLKTMLVSFLVTYGLDPFLTRFS
ncbi:hypothetical protein BU23DRAFT_572482 [Bimuria novae-zelandiae CBS 107.79]|uniref:Uncharacterized protein n=1 Tax=Bimuria novae-zelandiae CBS 107.79 TaxID=1447943 RepID=A0A6A5USS4_9PLEO|nr:hypothetical protein BU23DRAFT_572482 [Bimuria novae-zelandiae CBS 107.79]